MEKGKITGEIVVAFCGSRTFLGLVDKRALEEKVPKGELVTMRLALEITSLPLPIPREKAIARPATNPQVDVELGNLAAPHTIDALPCPVPILRIMVFGYYLVSQLPPPVRDHAEQSYKGFIAAGRAILGEMAKEAGPEIIH